MPAPVDISDPFRALSDPTRREIVSLLATGPLPVRMIASRFPSISRPAVSKHLRILREGGLVSEERSGRERHYRLELGTVATTLDWMASVSARAEGHLTRPSRVGTGVRAKGTSASKRVTSKPVARSKPEPDLDPAEPPPPAEAGVDSADWKSW